MSLHAEVRISLDDKHAITAVAPGEWHLKGRRVDEVFRDPPPVVAAILERLASGSTTGAELTALASAGEDDAGFFGYLELMFQLSSSCALLHTLWDSGRAIAELRWSINGSPLDPPRVESGERYALSRFASLRKDGAHLVAECPLGRAQVRLLDAAAADAVASLVQPATGEELARRVPALSSGGALLLLDLLLFAEAVAPVDEHGCVAAEESAPLGWWERHDLWFHSSCRRGRHDRPYGGTFVRRGVAEPLPLVRADAGEPRVPLRKADLEHLKQADEPFTSVLERRRSVRTYGAEPITIEQLGEFLYRAARIQAVLSTGPNDMQYSYRPTPGGGAIHELDIYPVVASCKGLEPGIYRYDALAHCLVHVDGMTPDVEELLAQAWITADKRSRPQVLLALAARFGRLQWKYESIVYATILKNVGALYATMYLVATAMKLAPCALGGGDSELFAAAAGVDYLAETTVGEFLLGSGGP